jgi:hypothetical protein
MAISVETGACVIPDQDRRGRRITTNRTGHAPAAAPPDSGFGPNGYLYRFPANDRQYAGSAPNRFFEARVCR